ncbi:tRNA (uracil-5-)-methyltransferase Gid [Listeria fleischmannii FSL S10-1203]|nr:tRNA (uracil-5-)-methyltransferase Gid [Listeria fleischmannii FSL S10-1203]
MHRNTFINSPVAMKKTYQLKTRDNLFFAGQMTGVEGYVESAASGLAAGINAARFVLGEDLIEFPVESAIGSMAHYITNTNTKTFQPMNVNFGLFPELPEKIKAKQERNENLANRALNSIKKVAEELENNYNKLS